jgi:hypothetical protein
MDKRPNYGLQSYGRQLWGLQSATLRVVPLISTRLTERVKRRKAEIIMRGALTHKEGWAKRSTGSGDS